ncbi:MAG: diguanylate cyclase [Solirubrobacterales bacterium]
MTHEPDRGKEVRSGRPLEGEGSGGDFGTRWDLEDRAEAADVDQTASDADQTASDADQTASDADQAQAETDQRAADRDQAAADRDLARHPEDHGDLEDYRRSRAERGFGERERQTGTMIRLRSAAARDEQGAQRDATAVKRDLAADVRDQLAESLEREAESAAVALEPPTDRALRDALALAATARHNAAADRGRAARDRERAGADREKAARDRNHATLELQAANMDELTGVYLRGMGESLIHHELLRAARSGDPLMVAFIDVDRLKEINDQEGYAAGDKLLRAVADALVSSLRPYDPVIRYGGDEFVCAFSGVDLGEAQLRLEEVNHSLAAASFAIGLTAALPDDTVASIIERSSTEMRKARGSAKRFPAS